MVGGSLFTASTAGASRASSIGIDWRRIARDGLIVLGGALALAYLVEFQPGAFDFHAYIRPDLTYPAYPGQPDAYLYSPAFAQSFAPLAAVPWPLLVFLWRAMLFGVLLWLAGPLTLPLLFVPFVMWDINVGNIDLLLGAVMVAGFRYPAAWSFVLLTKVTPGVGLLWFAVRREWRQLGIALGATAAIALASLLLFGVGPWAAWIGMLLGAGGHPISVWPIPLPITARLPIAAGLTICAGRTNRAWLVPVAAWFAMPVLWGSTPAMLVGVVPLLRRPGGRTRRWRTVRHCSRS